jgi:hypothetical protein
VNHHSSVETALDGIKTGEVMLPRDELIGNLPTGWAMPGIEMARARSGLLCGTAGTCDCDVKGDGQEKPSQGLSTEARRRGGRARMSDEGSVMDLEQRGSIVLLESSPTREGRSE